MVMPYQHYPDPDLTKVQALVRRVSSPFWMHRPEAWIWQRPDGYPQGFVGLMDSPGLCNLLWLSMAFDRPPQVYDANQNGLFLRLLSGARDAKLGGEPLTDWAGLLTLQEFIDQLPQEAGPAGTIASTYPLLRLLGERRLGHADA
jgi:hypothetical protein